jgi:toxin ParE1/3/4
MEALQDLEEIKQFIARDSPQNALSYIRRLYTHARSLKAFPLSGSVVTELGDSALREIRFGSYRIIYEIVLSTIRILSVYHAARQLDPHRVARRKLLDDQ